MDEEETKFTHAQVVERVLSEAEDLIDQAARIALDTSVTPRVGIIFAYQPAASVSIQVHCWVLDVPALAAKLVERLGIDHAAIRPILDEVSAAAPHGCVHGVVVAEGDGTPRVPAACGLFLWPKVRAVGAPN